MITQTYNYVQQFFQVKTALKCEPFEDLIDHPHGISLYNFVHIVVVTFKFYKFFFSVCGRRLFPSGRIVGGEKATFGKWPWQVM